MLGVVDHNAVMEVVDEDFLTESHKYEYVDNLTSIEEIDHNSGHYTIDGSAKGERDIDVYHAEKSEENINRITAYSQNNGLMVNEKKTQLLAVSSNKNRTKVWIQAGKTQIDSADQMKLLGFVYGERPDVSCQIDNLITRATKGMFVLRYYSRFMLGKDLRKLYSSLVRSVLEYSSVTYHSMLTKKTRE